MRTLPTTALLALFALASIACGAPSGTPGVNVRTEEPPLRLEYESHGGFLSLIVEVPDRFPSGTLYATVDAEDETSPTFALADGPLPQGIVMLLDVPLFEHLRSDGPLTLTLFGQLEGEDGALIDIEQQFHLPVQQEPGWLAAEHAGPASDR